MSDNPFTDDNDQSAQSDENPLKYPIASSRYVTVWIKEGNDSYYLNITVDAPLLGKETFNVSSTDRSQGFLNQIGEAWKDHNKGGAE